MKYVLKDEFFTYCSTDSLHEAAEALQDLRAACDKEPAARIYNAESGLLLTMYCGRPLRDFYDKCRKNNVKWPHEKLIFIDREMLPYGDRSYFVDEDGEFYEDYMSIGD